MEKKACHSWYRECRLPTVCRADKRIIEERSMDEVIELSISYAFIAQAHNRKSYDATLQRPK